MAKTYSQQQIRQIITAEAKRAGVDPALAIAIAQQESGLDPTRVGDNGTSFGLYQLHRGGELGGNSQDWANDPINNARTALAEVARVRRAHPDWSPGQVAAAAQRPADQVGYARSVDGLLGGKGGGGGAPVTANTPSGVQVDPNDLKARYGYAYAFYNSDPSLQKLLSQAVAQNWDKQRFAAELFQTPWYQKHSDAQRQWQLLQTTDPAGAQRQLGVRRMELAKQASSMGVNLSGKDLDFLANESLSQGFTGLQVTDALAGHLAKLSAGSHYQGAAGSLQDQIAQTYRDYGQDVAPATAQRWVTKILTQEGDLQAVKDAALTAAKALHPHLAAQLSGGATLKDIADPYVNVMAGTLELDPAGIDWLKDPHIQRALNYKPDGAKPADSPGLMSAYDFKNQLRQDPRWLKTQDARDQAWSTVNQIGKDWGMLA